MLGRFGRLARTVGTMAAPSLLGLAVCGTASAQGAAAPAGGVGAPAGGVGAPAGGVGAPVGGVSLTAEAPTARTAEYDAYSLYDARRSAADAGPQASYRQRKWQIDPAAYGGVPLPPSPTGYAPTPPAYQGGPSVYEGGIVDGKFVGDPLLVQSETRDGLDPYATPFGSQAQARKRAQFAEDAYCENFLCANCYDRWNFEKRIFGAYVHSVAHGGVTETSYGDAHAGQAGIELLPYVIQDGSRSFTRFGGTIMFDYQNYEGSVPNEAFSFADRAVPSLTVQSLETGEVFTTDNGETFSLMLGPTWRTDFDMFGIRMSPNVTAGLSLDWTNIDGRQIPPVDNTGQTIFGFAQTGDRQIDRYKTTGFDAGGFVRAVWDFGITERINFGVGGQYRFTPTNVAVDDFETRKHIGVVLQFSTEF